MTILPRIYTLSTLYTLCSRKELHSLLEISEPIGTLGAAVDPPSLDTVSKSSRSRIRAGGTHSRPRSSDSFPPTSARALSLSIAFTLLTRKWHSTGVRLLIERENGEDMKTRTSMDLSSTTLPPDAVPNDDETVDEKAFAALFDHPHVRVHPPTPPPPGDGQC